MSGCLPCFGKQKKYSCENNVCEKETAQPSKQEPNQPVKEEPQPISPSKAELKAAFFAESPQPLPTTDPFKEKAEKAALEREQKAKPKDEESVIQAAVVTNVESTPVPKDPQIEEKISKLKQDLDNLPEKNLEQFCLQALRVVKSLQQENLSDKMAGDLSGIVNKLEGLVTRLESVAIRAESRGGGDEDESASVQAFDDQIMGGKMKEYFRLSTEIGGEVAEHAQMVKEGCGVLRDLLVMSGKYKLPAKTDLPKIFKPLASKVEEIQSYADKRRQSKMNHNLQTVKEAVPALGWVSAPKPGNYVKEIKDQAMFYGNRVIKEYKGKDDKHVEWWRALCASLTDMEQFVKDYYLIGLTWNQQGQPWTESAGAPPPPPAGGAPPPPPPPAVLPPTAAPASKGDDDQAARNNLFASLNQGADVTKGLKKVTKDMQTHKNPGLRAGATVPDIKPTPAAKPAAAPAGKKTGPPRCELDGKKWIVEYQSNNPNVIVTGDYKQTVYIYKCDNSTIQVKGKLNSIVLDSCNKVGLVVEDVISTVDFINCQRVKGQVMGTIPCVNIDKTDGIEIYLSKESVKTEIITAKSSAMNILVPKDDDFAEYPLPEQFKASWNGKGFTTLPTEST